nr:hypothetical protein L203_03472 [Cryptococcus depauperatus CBS 7841]
MSNFLWKNDLSGWISVWMAFTSIIVTWEVDAAYCLSRPKSFPGGDWAWLWKPYNDFPYGEIDQLYGWKAFEDHDGFTAAQAMLNVVEVLLAVGYLYLRHTKPAGKEGQSCHATAPLSISAVGVIQGIMIGIPIGLYGSFQMGKARQSRSPVD